jgi:hypothetical protein
MNRRIRVLAGWALVIGIAAFLVGFIGSTPPTKIECGDDIMGPGDVCISTSSSEGGTYEERRSRAIDSAKRAPAAMLLGGALAAAGALTLIGAFRTRTRPRPPDDPDWWVGSAGSRNE